MDKIIDTAKLLFSKKVFYIDPCNDSEMLLSDKTICESINAFAANQNESCKILSSSAPIYFEMYGKTYLAASDGLLSQIAALTPVPIIACREV